MNEVTFDRINENDNQFRCQFIVELIALSFSLFVNVIAFNLNAMSFGLFVESSCNKSLCEYTLGTMHFDAAQSIEGSNSKRIRNK